METKAFQFSPLAPLTVETGSGSWPTPTANLYEVSDIPALLERREKCKAARKNGNGFGLTLQQAVAVRMWPTPCARDYMPAHKPEYIAAKKAEGHGMSILPDAVGGLLNPTWTEWLMGFPLGWTDCEL